MEIHFLERDLFHENFQFYLIGSENLSGNQMGKFYKQIEPI